MSKVLNVKKVLSTNTPDINDKSLKKDNKSNTTRIVIGVIIFIFIVGLCIGGWQLYKYITKETEDIASKIIVNTANTAIKIIKPPQRLLSFKIRGITGEEKFKLTLSDGKPETIPEELMPETLLSKTFVEYVKEIPYDKKILTLTFLNDGDSTTGVNKDIIIDYFKSDNVNILPNIRVRDGMDQPRIDKYRSGLFLWNGDYVFDLP